MSSDLVPMFMNIEYSVLQYNYTNSCVNLLRDKGSWLLHHCTVTSTCLCFMLDLVQSSGTVVVMIMIFVHSSTCKDTLTQCKLQGHTVTLAATHRCSNHKMVLTSAMVPQSIGLKGFYIHNLICSIISFQYANWHSNLNMKNSKVKWVKGSTECLNTTCPF